MLYQPAILRIFARDLGIDVTALQEATEAHDAAEIAAATARILDYLRHRNPGFFTYRFGRRQGSDIQAALRELQALATSEAAHGRQLSITPLHRYSLADSGTEVVESSPPAPHRW
jgi:hypothetical protein